jgi:hypothetical protein
MDCPWCGCGWLFICSRCRKAFTFAEAVELDEPWEQTADRAIRGLFQREPKPGQVEEWVGFMQILLKNVQPGRQYVYFDGYVISTTAERVAIEGWHALHDLDFVPQVAALTNSDLRDGLLCSQEYWQSNRVEEPDSDTDDAGDAPPPFTAEELAIVEARRQFTWRVVGVAPGGEVLYEVTNGSNRNLPFLSIGIRGKVGNLQGGVWLPVGHILPGQTAVIAKDTYRDLLDPDDVEAYALPDPEPKQRARYWEFRGDS